MLMGSLMAALLLWEDTRTSWARILVLAKVVAELQNASDLRPEPHFLLGWFSAGALLNDLKKRGTQKGGASH